MSNRWQYIRKYFVKYLKNLFIVSVSSWAMSCLLAGLHLNAPVYGFNFFILLILLLGPLPNRPTDITSKNFLEGRAVSWYGL